MLVHRLAAAALAAAALAFAAPASQAATFDTTFVDFGSQPIGAATVVNNNDTSTDTFNITNNTGSTWQSFLFDSSPNGVTYSNYVGPGFITPPSFGNFTIGGISIMDGGVLSFTITNSLNGTRSFSGTPSTDAIANPIPLPAAAWLLLGGLGALGAVARRKRAA